MYFGYEDGDLTKGWDKNYWVLSDVETIGDVSSVFKREIYVKNVGEKIKIQNLIKPKNKYSQILDLIQVLDFL